MALLEAPAGCQQTNVKHNHTCLPLDFKDDDTVESNPLGHTITFVGGMVVSANEMQKDKGQLKFRNSAWRVPKRTKGSCL